jgi:hypothetical protein
MPRSWRLAYLAVLLAAAGCSSPTTAPSASSQTLHGEVSDPTGDALSDFRVFVSPDLVHGTADVVAGNLTFVIQLAPGTLDRQTTRVSVLLDTDQNASTGVPEASGFGADYGIDLAAGTSQATVTKADAVGCAAHLSCFNAIGSAPITFVTDGMQVTVSLSLLGNDDGKMSFQMNSYVLATPSTSVVLDVMPDSNLPAGRIQ